MTEDLWIACGVALLGGAVVGWLNGWLMRRVLTAQLEAQVRRHQREFDAALDDAFPLSATPVAPALARPSRRGAP